MTRTHEEIKESHEMNQKQVTILEPNDFLWCSFLLIVLDLFFFFPPMWTAQLARLIFCRLHVNRLKCVHWFFLFKISVIAHMSYDLPHRKTVANIQYRKLGTILMWSWVQYGVTVWINVWARIKSVVWCEKWAVQFLALRWSCLHCYKCS